SQEQSSGIEQVNLTVTQMDEATQQNKARSYGSSHCATGVRIVFLVLCARHAKVILAAYGGVLSHRRGALAARFPGFHAALRFVPCAPLCSCPCHRGLFVGRAGAGPRRFKCCGATLADLARGDACRCKR
ncbi:hypothetical protein VDP35_17340, partial [Xanthomonas campestris pv. campestris]|nr:hypothetical protein [Xanthomonas campestris pv. campestris]